MKNQERRIKVVAVNNYKVESKFDIYLEFSGHREWLMMHRHSGILYGILKDGISLNELRRIRGQNQKRVQYLIKVIDEYLSEEMSA